VLVSLDVIFATSRSRMFGEPIPQPAIGPSPLKRMGVETALFGKETFMQMICLFMLVRGPRFKDRLPRALLSNPP
jgi:hypothetical protein